MGAAVVAVAVLLGGLFLVRRHRGTPVVAAGERWRPTLADLEIGCAAGDDGACIDVGTALAHDRSDDPRARLLLRRGCDAGRLAACNNLGYLLVNGHGGPPDPAGALALFQRACDGGDLHGCTSLGAHYREGLGAAVDRDRAARLFTRACDGGWAQGCVERGSLALARAEPEAALRWFERGCGLRTQGWPRACHELGQSHETGDGTRPDLDSATVYYGLACHGGEAAACNSLGLAEKRRGTAAALASADRHFQKACDLGERAGCLNLGARDR